MSGRNGHPLWAELRPSSLLLYFALKASTTESADSHTEEEAKGIRYIIINNNNNNALLDRSVYWEDASINKWSKRFCEKVSVKAVCQNASSKG